MKKFGIRPLGGPRMCCNDEVKKDLRRFGGNLDVVENRGIWRQYVDEAKNLLDF